MNTDSVQFENFVERYRKNGLVLPSDENFKSALKDGYLIAPIPEVENERIKCLRSFSLVTDESSSDSTKSVFKEIIDLAKMVFDVPMIAINLVEDSDTIMLAEFGLGCSKVDRNLTPCSHAILGQSPFVIPNLRNDWRFQNNPIVTGGPKIEFYAGMPLLVNADDTNVIFHKSFASETSLSSRDEINNTKHFSLGTFCLFDTKPRDSFGTADIENLKRLAELTVTSFKDYRKMSLLRLENSLQLTIMDCLQSTMKLESIDQCIDTFMTILQNTLKVSKIIITKPRYNRSLKKFDIQVKYSFGLKDSDWIENWDSGHLTFETFRSPSQSLQFIDIKDSNIIDKGSKLVYPSCVLAEDYSGCSVVLYDNEENAPRTNSLANVNNYDDVFGVLMIFSNDPRRPILGIYVNFMEQISKSLGYMIQRFRETDVIRKQQELEHQHRMELVASNERYKVSKKIIAAVSHEIKTPLYGITGAVETRPDCSMDCRLNLSIVSSCCDNLLHLANNLFDCGAYLFPGEDEDQKCVLTLKFKLKDFKVTSIMQPALQAVMYQMAQKQMSIKRLVTECSNVIHVDIEKIRQVVFNVLSNAIKYSPVEGELTISDGYSDNNYYLEIRDEGPGFPDDILNRIGEEFLHGNREEDGVGLGLFVSMKLMSSMQAKMSFSNYVDLEAPDLPVIGAKVRLEFPNFQKVSSDTSTKECNALADRLEDLAYVQMNRSISNKSLSLVRLSSSVSISTANLRHRSPAGSANPPIALGSATNDSIFARPIINSPVSRLNSNPILAPTSNPIESKRDSTNPTSSQTISPGQATPSNACSSPATVLPSKPLLHNGTTPQPVVVNPKIAVIDDNKIILTTISRQLQKLGYQNIRCFSSMDNFLQDTFTAMSNSNPNPTLKSNESFDIVFTDYSLPGKYDGASGSLEIKKRLPLAKIVLFSAMDIRLNELPNAAHLFLPKPVTLTNVQSTMIRFGFAASL